MNAISFEVMVTSEHRLYFELPESLPVGSTLKVTLEPVVHDSVLDDYQPCTELGHRLVALRRNYLQSGGKLLTWPELDAEMRRRRGGVADE